MPGQICVSEKYVAQSSYTPGGRGCAGDQAVIMSYEIINIMNLNVIRSAGGKMSGPLRDFDFKYQYIYD